MADRPYRPTVPLAPPIQFSSVWGCHSTAEAEAILGGTADGYLYQRDGHPGADDLAERIAAWHHADAALITSSGMSATAVWAVTNLRPGDHVVVAESLYGKTLGFLTEEMARWGVSSSTVDAYDRAAWTAALAARPRAFVVETISNPSLRVADLPALAEASARFGVDLVVDNTLATPVLCRPLSLGATTVLESATKQINGHSDLTLGMILYGKSPNRDADHLDPEVRRKATAKMTSLWGAAADPMSCWLCRRGMETLALRAAQACANAAACAERLAADPRVASVLYPGLPSHPDHELAKRLLVDGSGSIVTFTLSGGRDAVDRLLSAGTLVYAPSLGESQTTISHPETASHRGLQPSRRQALGITGGTVRLSCGIEPTPTVLDRLETALAASIR